VISKSALFQKPAYLLGIRISSYFRKIPNWLIYQRIILGQAPSEVVTLALLHAIKGGGTRAFYRWLTRDYLPLFPQVPERTRLARLFKTHTAWPARFLAAPTVLGVADTYGIELIHPMREGRSLAQVGKKGKSHHRWIVGGKLCFILNQWGVICAWDCATANIHDTHIFTR
jgi:hypothetical protein